MLTPQIDWNICQGCEPCQAKLVCKQRAIVQIDPGEPPYIEYDRCTNCGRCVAACLCQAITMSQDHIPPSP